MTITKWKTETYSDKIQRVECTRETDSSVWVLEYPWTIPGEKQKPPVERRRSKSSGDAYHDSWQAAHEHLMKRAERAVLSARSALQRAHDTLGNIKGMKPPGAQC